MGGAESRTILVIDDEPDIVLLVSETLDMEGYKVQTASNGREGLEIVQKRLPDLILLDMKMPVMSGPEFAREFHARFDRKAPIVILTAASEARARAEETGAADWLGKPFDLDALVDVVARRLPREATAT